ncbi:hypothetical protein [Salinimicrobium soli]|uniref:hypothetical protein n=1 Tax=Salinimicrobium soli TaxID=1254399 RepID=UPI003AB0B09F
MKIKFPDVFIKYCRNIQNWNEKLLGSRRYKKFVIISDARTGSTLLAQLLNSHPQIVCFGEKFKKLDSYPSSKIWSGIFRKRHRKIKWVGFKLFYFHPVQGIDKDIWNILAEDEEVVVIHLMRNNILRSYVSKKIGLQTRLWTKTPRDPDEIELKDKKVYLPPDECIETFKTIEKYYQETKKRFKSHKIIPVFYEDLSRNKQKEMNSLFKEFGVLPYEVSSTMIKQNPENLNDLIINYYELKEQFSGTKWERFFYHDTNQTFSPS